MTRTVVAGFAPIMQAKIIPIKEDGTDNQTYVKKEITASTLPPHKPAVTPRAVPIAVANSMPLKEINTVVRVAYRSRMATSLPKLSVPRRYSEPFFKKTGR